MSRDRPPQWAEATWDVAKGPTHPDPHTVVITGQVHTTAGRLPVTVALTDVQRLRMAAELTDVRRTADRTTVLPRPHTVVARTAGQCRLTAAVELRRTAAADTAGLRLPMVVAAGLRLMVVAERHPLAAVAAQADTAAVVVVTHLLEVEATAVEEEVVVTVAVAAVVTAAVDITKTIFI